LRSHGTSGAANIAPTIEHLGNSPRRSIERYVPSLQPRRVYLRGLVDLLVADWSAGSKPAVYSWPSAWRPGGKQVHTESLSRSLSRDAPSTIKVVVYEARKCLQVSFHTAKAALVFRDLGSSEIVARRDQLLAGLI
jgi:hypothetical protein